MPYDAQAAADFASTHAHAHSTGNCARYVRRAIEAGGAQLTRTNFAKDYGPALAGAGFQPAPSGPAHKGDVAVIQPAPGHPDGHMAIFNGNTWVSDFRQRPGPQGFYPGDAYRKAKPAYTIYRHR